MSKKITVRPGSGGRGYAVFWLSICVGSLMPKRNGRLKFHPYMRSLDIRFEPTDDSYKDVEDFLTRIRYQVKE